MWGREAEGWKNGGPMQGQQLKQARSESLAMNILKPSLVSQHKNSDL
jgi:hypothetical protein